MTASADAGTTTSGMGEQPGPYSARRLVENEEIMESLNRRLEERVAEVRAEDDEDRKAPIAFFCECSDIDCRARVSMPPHRYDAIHRDRQLFVVVPGHEIDAIETVADAGDGYAVVRKNIIP